jgi:hypothetical protein
VYAYIFVTAVVFGLIVVAHGARIVAEGLNAVHDPWFVLTSLAALALLVWAVCLLRRRTSATA